MQERIDNAIVQAKQERNHIDNELQRLHTEIEVKKAMKMAINSFIDKLEEIKKP